MSAEAVLGLFGKRLSAAAKSLQRYVNDGLTSGHNELYYKLKDQRILGEAEFADEIIKTGVANCNFVHSPPPAVCDAGLEKENCC